MGMKVKVKTEEIGTSGVTLGMCLATTIRMYICNLVAAFSRFVAISHKPLE